MKLRNKKTGEIDDVSIVHSANKIKGVVEHEDGVQCLFTYTLKEFNEEWEDYEETKKWRFIDCTGFIKRGEVLFTEKSYIKDIQEIGNYFATQEEAENAVEKLKAWKRLKDKGFKFERWLLGGEYGNTITFSGYFKCDDKTRADLDLLFGGEE